MNKILHFTLALLMTSLLQAQSVNKSKRHSFLTNSHSMQKRLAARMDIANVAKTLKLNSHLIDTLDLTTKTYSNSLKYSFEYDNNGNVINEIQTKYDGTNWINNQRTETIYNSNNQATSQIYYDWDGSNWVTNSKENYTYDTLNKITAFIDSIWDGTSWNIDSKIEFLYKNNNLYKKKHYYNKNGNLVISSMDSLNYDTNSNLLISSYKLGYNGSSLTISNKTEYNNDINSQYLVRIHKFFYSNTWTYSSKDSLCFDLNGNIIYYYYYSYNNKWDIEFKEEFTYDLSTSSNSIYWPLNQYPEISSEGNRMYSYNNKLTNIKETYYTNREIANIDSITFDYSTFTAIIDYDNSNNQIKVQNNPNDNSISFLLTDPSNEFTLNVYDVNGKLILNQIIQNQEVISLSSFKKGLYIFKVNNEKQSYTGKLLVE